MKVTGAPRVDHRVGRSSQATPATVDNSAPLVTDRRNGARDVRRNGASIWCLNRAPEGVEEGAYFAAFAGAGLAEPGRVLGVRYEAPSSTMQ